MLHHPYNYSPFNKILQCYFLLIVLNVSSELSEPLDWIKMVDNDKTRHIKQSHS